MDLLHSEVWKGEGVDGLWWKPASRGIFDVRSSYRVFQSPSQLSFPWKTVWSSKVPSKINFFVWTAALGRILTNDNLRNR